MTGPKPQFQYPDYTAQHGLQSPEMASEWQDFLSKRKMLMDQIIGTLHDSVGGSQDPNALPDPMDTAAVVPVRHPTRQKPTEELIGQARFWGIPEPENKDAGFLEAIISQRREEIPRDKETSPGSFALANLGAVYNASASATKMLANFFGGVEDLPFVGHTLQGILHTESARKWLQDLSISSSQFVELSRAAQPLADMKSFQFMSGAGKIVGDIIPMMMAWEGLGAIGGAALPRIPWLAKVSTPMARAALSPLARTAAVAAGRAVQGAAVAGVFMDPEASGADQAFNIGLGAVLGASSAISRLGPAVAGGLIGSQLAGQVGSSREEMESNKVRGGIAGAALMLLAPMAVAAGLRVRAKWEMNKPAIDAKYDIEDADYTIEPPDQPPLPPRQQVSGNPPIRALLNSIPPDEMGGAMGAVHPEAPPPQTPEDLHAILFRGEPTRALGPGGVPETPQAPETQGPYNMGPPRVAGLLPPQASGTAMSASRAYIQDNIRWVETIRDQGVSSGATEDGLHYLDGENVIRNGETGETVQEELDRLNNEWSGRLQTEDQVRMAASRGLNPITKGPNHLLGSKVSDAEGKALRVYHGTGLDYDQMDPSRADPTALYGPGLYFTENPDIAGGNPAMIQQRGITGLDQLAAQSVNPAGQPTDRTLLGYSSKAGDSPQVRPAFLNIKAPFDADRFYSRDELSDLIDHLAKHNPEFDWDTFRHTDLVNSGVYQGARGQDLYRVLEAMPREGFNWEDREDMRDVGHGVLGGIDKPGVNMMLRNAGFDGITHIGGDIFDGVGHRVWVAFDPTQIHSPWPQTPLDLPDAITQAHNLTKQAILMESAELPSTVSKAEITDADVAVSAYANNPGGISVIKDVTQVSEILNRVGDYAHFIEMPDGKLDLLIGSDITDRDLADYKRTGFMLGMEVIDPRTHVVGRVLDLTGQGVRVESQNVFRNYKVSELFPTRYTAATNIETTRPVSGIWSDFKDHVLESMNTEAEKAGMAPVTSIWDDRVPSVLQSYVNEYMTLEGIDQLNTRHAVDLALNQAYINEARDLDPETKKLIDDSIARSAAAHNARMEPIPVSMEEMASARGFVWLKDIRGPGGRLRDNLNPDTASDRLFETDQAAQQFLREVDRSAPDLTPGAVIPADVMMGAPSDPTLRPRLSLEETAENLGTNLDDIFSKARTPEGKIKAGVDPSIMYKLGAQMYSGDVGAIAIKEGIQNAIDAVRMAGGGRLDVNYDATDKTLTIGDSGIGMSPEQVETVFVDIGGSGKDVTESAGGFGLAKVALFGNAKMIDVSTVHRTPDGRTMWTTLKGSGDDWVSGNMEMQTRELNTLPGDEAEDTGTEIKLTLTPEANVSTYNMNNWLSNFSRFSRSEVPYTASIKEYGGFNKYESGQGAPMQPESKGQFQVPGATINVYETQARRAQTDQYSSRKLDVHVLNRGIYQFTDERYLESPGGPEALVVDVQPTVDLTDPDYPFTTSREALKREAAGLIDKITKKAAVSAGHVEFTNIVGALKNAPAVMGKDGQPTKFKVLADDVTLPPELHQKIAALPYLDNVSNLGESLMHAIVDAAWTNKVEGAKAMGAYGALGQAQPRPTFGGLGASMGWYGVNIQVGKLHEMAKAIDLSESEDYSQKAPNEIYWNPFATFKTVNDAMQKGGGQPLPQDIAGRMATRFYATMVHEVAHQLARGHDENFSSALTALAADAAHLPAAWLSHATELFERMLGQPFFEVMDDLSDQWSRATTNRVLKKLSVDDPAGATGGPEGLGGGDAGGSDETRGAPGHPTIADRVDAFQTPRYRTDVRGGEEGEGMGGAASFDRAASPPPPPPASPLEREGFSGPYSPLNPRLGKPTESLGGQFDRLRRDDPARYNELLDKYKSTVFKYTRYHMAGLENDLMRSGVDMGRSWRDYDTLEQARAYSDYNAHPWLEEYSKLMRQFPRELLRKGNVHDIRSIADPNARYAAWWRLKDEMGYSNKRINGLIKSDAALKDFWSRWYENLTGDAQYGQQAEQEFNRWVGYVRQQQAIRSSDPYNSTGLLSDNLKFMADYARQRGQQFRIIDPRELGTYVIRSGMFQKYEHEPWTSFMDTWKDQRIPKPIRDLMLDHGNAMRYGYDPRGDLAVRGVQLMLNKVLKIAPVTKAEAEHVLAAPVTAGYMSMLGGKTSIFFRDAMQPLLSLAKVRGGYLRDVYLDLLNGKDENALQAMYKRGYEGGWILKDTPAMESLGLFEDQSRIRDEVLQMTPTQSAVREGIAKVGDALYELPLWMRSPTQSNISTLKWYGKQQGLHRLVVGEAAYRQAKDALATFRRSEMEAALSRDVGRAIPYEKFAENSFFSSFSPPIQRHLQELVDAGDDEGAAQAFARETDRWTNLKYGKREMPPMLRGTFGRLMSMFGNFTGQFIGGAVSALSHGKWSHRARAVAAIGGLQLFLNELEDVTGWNFSSWGPLNALKYAGGPGAETVSRVAGAVGGIMAQSDDRQPSPFQRSAMQELADKGVLPSPSSVFPYSGYLRTAGEIADALQGTNPLEQVSQFMVTGERGGRGALRREAASDATRYEQRHQQNIQQGAGANPNPFGLGLPFPVIPKGSRSPNGGMMNETTPIPPGLEPAFKSWVRQNKISDLDNPNSHYDYRGAFLAGVHSQINPTDSLPHWPDRFKQHGHPTFSVKSQYSHGPDDGGRWEGERYIPQRSHPGSGAFQ